MQSSGEHQPPVRAAKVRAGIRASEYQANLLRVNQAVRYAMGRDEKFRRALHRTPEMISLPAHLRFQFFKRLAEVEAMVGQKGLEG